MARPADITETVIDAAFGLIAEHGWRRLTMRDIADASGLSAAELHAAFLSKHGILRAFQRRIDAAVLSSGEPPDADDSTRDRLFDVVMRRLDALAPYKPAIARLRREAMCRPSLLACIVPDTLVSMAWMLEAAGVGGDGPAGIVRAKVLAAVYLSVLDVWLKDDSPDMASTMAALDKRLERVEMAVHTCRKACQRHENGALQK